MKLLHFCIIYLVLFWSTAIYGQNIPIKTKTYYPKDSLRFAAETDFSFHNEVGYEQSLYGKTTMIIKAESRVGNYYLIFKKKIKSTDHQEAHMQDVYGTLADGTYAVVRQDEVPGYTLTDHNLYAFIFIEDHAGLLEKVRFQDFGNMLYWPQFDYENCFVADENRDGLPEFYLSYMGDSDGLDAKPYKQLVYYFTKDDKQFVKAKATAYYPAGNEEDVYHVDYDQAWKNMPVKFQHKSKAVLARIAPEL